MQIQDFKLPSDLEVALTKLIIEIEKSEDVFDCNEWDRVPYIINDYCQETLLKLPSDSLFSTYLSKTNIVEDEIFKIKDEIFIDYYNLLKIQKCDRYKNVAAFLECVLGDLGYRNTSNGTYERVDKGTLDNKEKMFKKFIDKSYNKNFISFLSTYDIIRFDNKDNNKPKIENISKYLSKQLFQFIDHFHTATLDESVFENYFEAFDRIPYKEQDNNDYLFAKYYFERFFDYNSYFKLLDIHSQTVKDKNNDLEFLNYFIFQYPYLHQRDFYCRQDKTSENYFFDIAVITRLFKYSYSYMLRKIFSNSDSFNTHIDKLSEFIKKTECYNLYSKPRSYVDDFNTIKAKYNNNNTTFKKILKLMISTKKSFQDCLGKSRLDNYGWMWSPYETDLSEFEDYIDKITSYNLHFTYSLLKYMTFFIPDTFTPSIIVTNKKQSKPNVTVTHGDNIQEKL